jgi:hypothetical protein
MQFRTRIRINKLTGEVDVEIIDEGSESLPSDQHNARHDRIAAEVGSVIDRNPRVQELLHGESEAERTVETSGPESTISHSPRPQAHPQ